MKILLPASEVSPIIKIGGLGDVLGSLPRALSQLGVDADVISPFFPSAKVNNTGIFKQYDLYVPFNSDTHKVEVFKGTLPNSDVNVFLLKYDRYFSGGGSSFFKNDLTETAMFAFFDKCVVEFIKAGFNTYDIVHCHDWHTGLITHLLQDELGQDRPRTLFTIHNLMYQGVGDAEIIRQSGLVPGSHPLIDWDVSDGDINFLQQGITSSDYISTVSKTYAEEILTKEFGSVFFDLLASRSSRLVGILNGIDYHAFPRKFDLSNYKDGKAKAKTALKKRLGLTPGDKPLFAFIGRIDPYQKGIDLIYDIIPELVKKGGQFILLGTGDPAWEKKLLELAKDNNNYENNVHLVLDFDLELAKELYSASDFLLVPSRYEPCGLIQMIAMWYGSLPVVRATGGLKDSVTDSYNGIVYKEHNVEDFLKGINRAFKLYSSKDEFSVQISNALKMDFSWSESAKEYVKLYARIIEGTL